MSLQLCEKNVRKAKYLSPSCRCWEHSIYRRLSPEITSISFIVNRTCGCGGAVDAFSRLGGGVSCTSELQRALPILQKAYGDSMQKVLHVGPDTCSVVSTPLKEEGTEAWDVEPYELDETCKSLVYKGIVRVADIQFPLPYRSNSFSLVIVSDAMDYLSPKYLNKTLLELARVAASVQESERFIALSSEAKRSEGSTLQLAEARHVKRSDRF